MTSASGRLVQVAASPSTRYLGMHDSRSLLRRLLVKPHSVGRARFPSIC